MNQIILYKEDLLMLEQYAKEKDLLFELLEPPFKDVELVIYRNMKGEVTKDDNNAHKLNMKTYHKGTYINLYIAVDGKPCGKLRVSTDGKLLQNKLTEKIEDKKLTMFYAVYFYLMDYIINHKKEQVLKVKDSKTTFNKHKNSKKKVSKVTYLFHSSVSSAKGGHHKSPSHAFTVRGHYRHLKDGRKVWVKEHTKCTNKAKKDKVYKF
jgi:hypothetical protein